MRHRPSTLFLLSLALIGYWSPWFTHPVSALRLNGYELSEWITFLPEARGGVLPVNRLSFFIPLAGVAWLLACAAARYRGTPPAHWRAWWSGLPRRTALSWGLLALAALCAFMVFPPYEAYTRADYWPDYQTQFVVAMLTAAGIVLAFVLPAGIRDLAQTVVALTGAGFGAWAFWAVRPMAIGLLGWRWMVLGNGWALLLFGLAGLAWLGLAHLFGPKD